MHTMNAAEITDTRADDPDPQLWTPAELAAMKLPDALVRRLAVNDVLFICFVGTSTAHSDRDDATDRLVHNRRDACRARGPAAN